MSLRGQFDFEKSGWHHFAVAADAERVAELRTAASTATATADPEPLIAFYAKWADRWQAEADARREEVPGAALREAAATFQKTAHALDSATDDADPWNGSRGKSLELIQRLEALSAEPHILLNRGDWRRVQRALRRLKKWSSVSAEVPSVILRVDLHALEQLLLPDPPASWTLEDVRRIYGSEPTHVRRIYGSEPTHEESCLKLFPECLSLCVEDAPDNLGLGGAYGLLESFSVFEEAEQLVRDDVPVLYTWLQDHHGPPFWGYSVIPNLSLPTLAARLEQGISLADALGEHNPEQLESLVQDSDYASAAEAQALLSARFEAYAAACRRVAREGGVLLCWDDKNPVY